MVYASLYDTRFSRFSQLHFSDASCSCLPVTLIWYPGGYAKHCGALWAQEFAGTPKGICEHGNCPLQLLYNRADCFILGMKSFSYFHLWRGKACASIQVCPRSAILLGKNALGDCGLRPVLVYLYDPISSERIFWDHHHLVWSMPLIKSQ